MTEWGVIGGYCGVHGSRPVFGIEINKVTFSGDRCCKPLGAYGLSQVPDLTHSHLVRQRVRVPSLGFQDSLTGVPPQIGSEDQPCPFVCLFSLAFSPPAYVASGSFVFPSVGLFSCLSPARLVPCLFGRWFVGSARFRR